jgi:ribose transport system substrate-binding protein
VISFVRTDNEAASRLAGQFIGSELDGEGTVLNIQGDLSNPVAQLRDAGLREGLGAYPGIESVSGEGSWNFNSAFSLALQQLPVADEGTPAPPAPLVDAIFGANPAMTLGAATAVETLEADSVRIYGFGVTEEALQGIRDGTVRAVIAELPARAGVLAVHTIVQYLNGDAVPEVVDSGFTVVTSGNLDAFQAPAS